MKIYSVKQILEPDYGCEDSGRKEPMALLVLEDMQSGEEKPVEVAEKTLSAQGITEGKKVCFTASGEIRKYVRVVAAVICDYKNGEQVVFSTARGYGSYKGWWEFPGGKIEKGETPQQALKREIREELTAEIEVGEFIKTIEYDYPEFHLSMDCYWCSVKEGHLTLLEHEAARWLPLDNLRQVNWLPADVLVVDEIERIREKDVPDE